MNIFDIIGLSTVGIVILLATHGALFALNTFAIAYSDDIRPYEEKNINQIRTQYLSGRLIKWYLTNKRLNGEARALLCCLYAILGLPILLVNLIQAILYLMRGAVRGGVNILWVVGTDLAAKETGIDPNDFDNFKKELEEFIDKIPDQGRKEME